MLALSVARPLRTRPDSWFEYLLLPREGDRATTTMTPRHSPRHDHDAGGDPGILAAKAALRERVWASLDQPGIARFPRPTGRIPNFVGAEAAARHLAETDEWQGAATLKANPDSPQWPVRERALRDGKTLYMAVPRLADANPFFLLDPSLLVEAAGSVTARAVTSIKGATQHARTVDVRELEPVDLVVAGCVAVDERGARLGKGGGFSDLELAVAADAGLVDARTVVATTVHDRQVLPSGSIPATTHDIHVDVVVTPQGVIRCPRPRDWELPALRWEELTPEKIAAIPLLGRLAP
jgi:5-formyltetrahydrofolate cyclo-ligase